MFERIKNLFLSYLYPASFFFLTFCAGPKEHKIPYEQMPIKAKQDATPAQKDFIASFKKHYTAKHIEEILSTTLENQLADLKKSPNFNQADFDKNFSLLFVGSPGSNGKIGNLHFSKSFLTAIAKGKNRYNIKNNLETFITSNLGSPNTPLGYAPAIDNALSPLFFKTGSSKAYTDLYELILISLYEREDFRKEHYVMIFTPQQHTIGFVIKQTVKSWLLFGLNTNALGPEAVKYYGPTAKLNDKIVVVDLELDLLLKHTAASLQDIPAARSFAIEHSAKKYKYDVKRLKNTKFKEFKADGSVNIFDVEGSVAPDAPPAFAVNLNPGDFTYVEGYSDLDLPGLQASYTQYLAVLAQRAEEKRLTQEKNRLGANFQLVADWTKNFGTWDQMDNVARKFLQGKAFAGSPDDISILPIKADRNCHEESNANAANEKFLLSWAILGTNQSWTPQILATNNLQICRTKEKRNTGTDNTVDFLPENSRVLQPVYLSMAKDPTDLRGGQAQLAASFASTFCSQIGFVDASTQSSIKDSLEVKKLWQELFYKNPVDPNQSFAQLAPTHNFYQIRCVFIPSKQMLDDANKKPATPAPGTPPVANDNAARLRNNGPLPKPGVGAKQLRK